jgi:transcriptional regulator with XRE-family HTH domain
MGQLGDCKTSRWTLHLSDSRPADRGCGASLVDLTLFLHHCEYRVESMDLASVFDIDPNDPEVKLALALAEQDHQLLRRLVTLRQELELSQADVAERLGITQPSVAAFERYESDPKLSTIRKYAQVVGLLVTHQVEIDLRTTQPVNVQQSVTTTRISAAATSMAGLAATDVRIDVGLPTSVTDSERTDFALAA